MIPLRRQSKYPLSTANSGVLIGYTGSQLEWFGSFIDAISARDTLLDCGSASFYVHVHNASFTERTPPTAGEYQGAGSWRTRAVAFQVLAPGPPWPSCRLAS